MRSVCIVLAAVVAVAVACGGPEPATKLEIHVTGYEIDRRFTLECGPPGGTARLPGTLCVRVAWQADELLRQPPREACRGADVALRPPHVHTVAVRGTYRGRNVDVSLETCPWVTGGRARRWLDLLGVGTSSPP